MSTAVTTPKPLTPQQLVFVTEYMKDSNGSRAAAAAGYSQKDSKRIATRLLSTNVHIRAEINRRLAEYERTAGVAMVDVLEGYKRIAFADPGKLFNGNGGMLSPEAMPEEVKLAIDSIELQSYTPPGDGAEPEHTKKIRFSSRLHALDRLYDHLKPLPDRGSPAVPAVAVQVNVDFGQAMRELRAALES